MFLRMKLETVSKTTSKIPPLQCNEIGINVNLLMITFHSEQHTNPGPNLSTLGTKPLYNASILDDKDKVYYRCVISKVSSFQKKKKSYPSSLATVATAGKVQLYFLGPVPLYPCIRVFTTSKGVFNVVPTVPPIAPAVKLTNS